MCCAFLWGAPSICAAVKQVEVSDQLSKAYRAASQGTYTLALEFYLTALEDLESLDPHRRYQLLEGLLSTCQHLLEQKNTSSVLRGLIAMLKPTSKLNRLLKRLAIEVRTTLQRIAEALLMENAPHLAVPALEALVDDSKDLPSAWTLLARAYAATTQFEKANILVQRAFERFPNHPLLYLAKADLVRSQAGWAVGQADYKQAGSLLQAAAAELTREVQSRPYLAELQRALGQVRSFLWSCYQVTGQYPQNVHMLEAAEQAYLDAARLDPNDPQAAFDLGMLLYAAKDWVWAEKWFEEAYRRYQLSARGQKQLVSMERRISRTKVSCLHFQASALYQRAVDAANLGQFETAGRLIEKLLGKMPEHAGGLSQLKPWLSMRQQKIKSNLSKLRSLDKSVQAQLALGDLLMRLGRFSEARQTYLKLLSFSLQKTMKTEIQDRLHDIRAIDGPTKQERFSIGELRVHMELPSTADLGLLKAAMQKAHAMTMSVFPHNMDGVLKIRVFASRRALLEHVGPRAWINRAGIFSHGKLATYIRPGRKRSAWIEIFVRALARRYVHEMSFSKAPHWLAEGIARWVERPVNRSYIKRLPPDQAPCPWGRLDLHLLRSWNEPESLEILCLQSHHMISWLAERFGARRVFMLLNQLRGGRSLEGAVMAAFGLRLEHLERRWKLALRHAPKGSDPRQ